MLHCQNLSDARAGQHELRERQNELCGLYDPVLISILVRRGRNYKPSGPRRRIKVAGRAGLPQTRLQGFAAASTGAPPILFSGLSENPELLFVISMAAHSVPIEVDQWLARPFLLYYHRRLTGHLNIFSVLSASSSPRSCRRQLSRRKTAPAGSLSAARGIVRPSHAHGCHWHLLHGRCTDLGVSAPRERIMNGFGRHQSRHHALFVILLSVETKIHQSAPKRI